MTEKAQRAQNLEFTNTNKWDTRQLVTMALMCAIAALLSFIQIPLIPGVTFLTYDPSLMPAMVCGFAFGPWAPWRLSSTGSSWASGWARS